MRSFGQERDACKWLALRQRAFASQIPSARRWSESEFEREFLKQPWWNPQRMWLIDANDSPDQIVGAVTMALRESGPRRVPAIHWLMVDPQHRGQGMGERLIRALETAAWHDGYREVVLETHANWKAAVALYRKLGYRDRDLPAR